MANDRFRIGVITAPHGVRGEMRVFPTTDEPARFSALEHVLVEKPGGAEEMRVLGVRFHKQMVILKLAGVDSMDEAQLLRDSELYVRREDALPLSENEYYIADLIGLDVLTDEGEMLGTLRDVIQTGANDVYVVYGERYGEILIPVIADSKIRTVLAEGRMYVHLLPGLINRKETNA